MTDNDTENRYERTKVLTALFKDKGYTVIEKWECVFNTDLKTDPEMRAYFEAHPTTRTPPLILRDALVGGRTSALRWYHKADLDRGEKIKMVDVVSEYPNANLRGDYPYGHPKIYLEGNPDMPDPDQWNGMIKCTVLPPRDLFIPVLPYKANGKLMFPLCRTYVEIQKSEGCHHEDPRERQLTRTWCAPELLLALREKSYELIKVHEVHQYPGTVAYNPETGEDGLLSGYVRCFMALKMQASGWPPECDSDDKKEQSIKDTLKHDGVVLDPAKMVKNSALRTMAKLMCNSFWGKFGEKTLRSRTDLIYDPAKLMPLLTDPRKEVTGLLPLSEECIQVTWKPVEDSETSLPTSSILHAAFTTCFGRLQLYKYLDVVKERALYHNTGSVAYISRPGEPDLPLGTHLGDLTDQVEEDYGSGSFITEFVAGGPKNYAYKVAVGGDPTNIKVCIKVRGISINKSCDDLITFDNLKANVMGNTERLTVPIPHQIARLPGWKIVIRSTRKIWQAVNTKRRRVCVEHTVPFGYNAWTMAPEEDQDLLEVMDLLADA
ncbi:DNA polymerase [Frankliniella fusca]|uniref:DNA-directed DNA polymerase n=1 Tax=Frankliniella fusca TaxID=407009 RepID=A0AAE1GWR3_9NEOP|nr:DNA polymerase [Frankliniella fusca]